MPFSPSTFELTQTVEPSAFCNLKKNTRIINLLARGGGKFAPCTGRTHLPSRWCKWAPGILVAVRETVGESWRRWDFCQEVTIEIHLERQAVKTHHEEVVNYDQTWTSTTMQRGKSINKSLSSSWRSPAATSKSTPYTQSNGWLPAGRAIGPVKNPCGG